MQTIAEEHADLFTVLIKQIAAFKSLNFSITNQSVPYFAFRHFTCVAYLVNFIKLLELFYTNFQ